MRCLVTGAAGFAGHHLVNHLLIHTDWDIVIFDKLTYASAGYDRLRDVNCFDDKRIKIFNVELENEISEGVKQEVGNVDYIVHMAAETHVDRSIDDPWPFIRSNILGTTRMLDYARTLKDLKQFVYFSTDEVFGPAPKGVFYKEWDRFDSSNPYAASKAGGEEMCLAYANTYKIPMLISHSMNLFGERQHSEKYIPLCINSILSGRKLIIHSDSTKKIPGSRCWIHARTVAAAVLFLLKTPVKRDKINIVGQELNNLEIAKHIATILDMKLNYELVDFHSARPGHDLRYALSGTKLKKMGFRSEYNLRDSLAKTVKWSILHNRWLK